MYRIVILYIMSNKYSLSSWLALTHDVLEITSNRGPRFLKLSNFVTFMAPLQYSSAPFRVSRQLWHDHLAKALPESVNK